MATTEATRRKTIKLVFTPQDHELGYRDYVADHDLSDSPSILKSIGNNAQREMNLLFRGRKVTPEEEAMTFEALMQKVCALQVSEIDCSFMLAWMRRCWCLMVLFRNHRKPNL